MSQLLAEIEHLVTPALMAESMELVDLTYQREPSGWTLCFYLDKPGGITLDDCEVWSDRLGNILDASDVLKNAYNLEVSSPGLQRALRKTKDFEKFSGQQVHAKLFAPIDGQKNFHGTLLGADEVVLKLKLEDGRDIELPRTLLAKCRLDPVIEI